MRSVTKNFPWHGKYVLKSDNALILEINLHYFLEYLISKLGQEKNLESAKASSKIMTKQRLKRFIFMIRNIKRLQPLRFLYER